MASTHRQLLSKPVGADTGSKKDTCTPIHSTAHDARMHVPAVVIKQPWYMPVAMDDTLVKISVPGVLRLTPRPSPSCTHTATDKASGANSQQYSTRVHITRTGPNAPSPQQRAPLGCLQSIAHGITAMYRSFYPVIRHNFTASATEACTRRPSAAANMSRRRRERRLQVAAGELAAATRLRQARPLSACISYFGHIVKT